MPDRFAIKDLAVSDPAFDAAVVTPHNTNELAVWSRAIYVGVGGDIAVTMASGAEVTFIAVPQGTILPIRAKIVKSTGTTAASLISLT